METRIAVFIDFENIKRAVDDYFVNERVDIKRIFSEIGRVSGARITFKRAYADWGVFKDYRSDLLDNATEPVQAFALTYKGKNGADIRIAIDVMDVVLRQTDVTHVALVSGDSDFTPLVMKLREFGKTVIGVGVRSNTSNYLAKACDTFCYYDDLRGAVGEALPERSVPSEPGDPVALLASALAYLGNKPVPGSALKSQMRKMDVMFDETRWGHTGFLDFLRAHADIVDLYKPAVGDITVAPKGQLPSNDDMSQNANGGDYRNGNGDMVSSPPVVPKWSHPNYTPYVPTGGIPYQAPPPPPAAPMTTTEHYRLWLRDNNFRYVAHGDRHFIVQVVYDLFRENEPEPISLKESKDRLHLWFEQNRPSVPWESINSTVYHLFYTWCFDFDKSDGDDGKQLWDRRTTLRPDIHSPDELICKSERGIVRKLWERERTDLDVDALNEWLYGGDEEKREYVAELVKSVTSGSGLAGYTPYTSTSGGAVIPLRQG